MAVFDFQTELRAEERRQLLDVVLPVVDTAHLIDGTNDFDQLDEAARPTERRRLNV